MPPLPSPLPLTKECVILVATSLHQSQRAWQRHMLAPPSAKNDMNPQQFRLKSPRSHIVRINQILACSSCSLGLNRKQEERLGTLTTSWHIAASAMSTGQRLAAGLWLSHRETWWGQTPGFQREKRLRGRRPRDTHYVFSSQILLATA